MALILAFAGVWITGPLVIPLLHKLKFGQQVRDDGPQNHLKKMGTPTMGGILIIGAVVLASLLTGSRTLFLTVALMAVVGFSSIGFADDYLKVVLKRPLGLKARAKLAAQIAGGFLLVYATSFLLQLGTDVQIPFAEISMDLGWLYVPFGLVLVLGAVNGVNLSDGLDGLAAGTMIFPLALLGWIGMVQSQPDVVVLALSGVGACVGFLVYNIHPARIFMGDTGSFALGALLAALVLMTKTELLLPILGGVYVIESISVILQVVYLRLTGRRVFKMAPLHHHYELSGWSEQKVVQLFWSLSALCSILAYLVYRFM